VVIYNISLLTDLYEFVSVISANNSVNLSYVWGSTGTPDGYYQITASACDNQTQCSTGYSGNFTIDNTAPVVSLVAPANSTSSAVNAYNFTFNATDLSGLSSCSLIFNGSAINTLTTVYRNAENNFSNSSLPIGAFNWSVNCTDLADNTANSGNFELTIQAAPPSPSGSSGGGGNAARAYYSYINSRKQMPRTAARTEQTAVLDRRAAAEDQKSEQEVMVKSPAGITGNAVRAPVAAEYSADKTESKRTAALILALVLAALICAVVLINIKHLPKNHVVVKLHKDGKHSDLLIRLNREHHKEKQQ
jgi:hypothetical protein